MQSMTQNPLRLPLGLVIAPMLLAILVAGCSARPDAPLVQVPAWSSGNAWTFEAVNGGRQTLRVVSAGANVNDVSAYLLERDAAGGTRLVAVARDQLGSLGVIDPLYVDRCIACGTPRILSSYPIRMSMSTLDSFPRWTGIGDFWFEGRSALLDYTVQTAGSVDIASPSFGTISVLRFNYTFSISDPGPLMQKFLAAQSNAGLDLQTFHVEADWWPEARMFAHIRADHGLPGAMAITALLPIATGADIHQQEFWLSAFILAAGKDTPLEILEQKYAGPLLPRDAPFELKPRVVTRNLTATDEGADGRYDFAAIQAFHINAPSNSSLGYVVLDARNRQVARGQILGADAINVDPYTVFQFHVKYPRPGPFRLQTTWDDGRVAHTTRFDAISIDYARHAAFTCDAPALATGKTCQTERFPACSKCVLHVDLTNGGHQQGTLTVSRDGVTVASNATSGNLHYSLQVEDGGEVPWQASWTPQMASIATQAPGIDIGWAPLALT